MGQPVGVVDTLIAGEAAEHGLTKQTGQQAADGEKGALSVQVR
jgi:hypothetical protein